MRPMPKRKRVKLTPKELSELKSEISWDQKYECKICRAWIGVAGHLHHKKTRGAGGDDSKENCVVLCHVCHRKVHDGNLKI